MDAGKENYTTFVLRIVLYATDGTAISNKTHPLRPDHWTTDLDRICALIPAFTNEMKCDLKDNGYVKRQDAYGTAEFLLQEIDATNEEQESAAPHEKSSLVIVP